MKITGIVWLVCHLSLFAYSFNLQAQETQVVESTEVVETASEVLDEAQAYELWAKEIWDSLDRQTGEIDLPGNAATLTVPENFYYLDPTDTKRILVDVWGNPEGSTKGLLGMLFPADSTPFDDASWGVTIEYEQDGYVNDEDAADLDYNELLADMQQDTLLSSEARVEQGYEPIELVGWAAAPFYDSEAKKLHWAKELHFGDAELNTLNYNIRILGRKGVLVLNFIAGMDQLDVINNNLDTVLAMAEFKEGSRYADFNPDIDDVAAYGVGALITGKVLAKTGFLAAALLFLKKFGVFILVGLFALGRKLFSRKPAE